MIKTIEVEEGRLVSFKASAFSPIAYNMIYPNGDFIGDMKVLEETNRDMGKDDEGKKDKALPLPVYQYFIRIAYLFHYQALAPSPAQTDEQRKFLLEYPDPWSWIDTFDTFSIYTILPEIMELYLSNEIQKSQAKKAVPAPPVK